MLNPQVGRWMQEDPIRTEAGDTNLYRDVHNNPTNLVDPSGLDPFGDIFGPGGVIDDIVPDPVSNAAAGFLDGWSNGMASHAARSRIQRQHDQAPGARRPGERPK